MSIAYIRKTYGLAHKVGDQVSIRLDAGTRFDGCRGRLVRARGQYLVVKGDTWRGTFHPADVAPVTASA